jgi:hypothetical protein
MVVVVVVGAGGIMVPELGVTGGVSLATSVADWLAPQADRTTAAAPVAPNIAMERKETLREDMTFVYPAKC